MIKLRRLTDEEIKFALRRGSDGDLMFDAEEYLKEGLSVAQAQLDLTKDDLRKQGVEVE